MIRPLRHLTFEDITQQGWKLDDDFRLGCRPNYPAALAEYFAGQAGELNSKHISETPSYAYVANTYAKGTMDNPNAASFLNIFVNKTQRMLSALWLVKDNCVNGTRAYLRIDDESGTRYWAQDHGTQFSRADFEQQPSHFTMEEMTEAVKLYYELEVVVPKHPENERVLSGLVSPSRLARVLWNMEATRNEADLAHKIASYCMCFETLFSTATTEVSHRVSERTAVFLGAAGAERRTIYDDIHRLYGIRSATVHGSHVKLGDVPKVLDRTRRADSHLRNCLLKILRAPALLELFQKGKDEKINAYFVDQLFPLN